MDKNAQIDAWKRDIAKAFQDRLILVLEGTTEQTKTDLANFFTDIRNIRSLKDLPRIASKAFELADGLKDRFWQSKPDLQVSTWLKRLGTETILHGNLFRKGIRWQDGNDQQIDHEWMKTPFADLVGSQKQTAAASRYIDRQRGKYTGTSFKEYATHIHRLWIANNPKEALKLGLSLKKEDISMNRKEYDSSLNKYANVRFIA